MASNAQRKAVGRALGTRSPSGEWGVRPKAAPVRSGRPELRHQGSGNRRRRPRRVGAAAANERRAVRPEPQAVVRGTLPEAKAVVSAWVLGTAARRSAEGDARRSRHRRRTKCRGDVGAATAVSEASRRASGARSDRRERRREGYPPEGPRPRSGLGRVARSRSDAPNPLERRAAPASVFGTDPGIADSIAKVVALIATSIAFGSDSVGERP